MDTIKFLDCNNRIYITASQKSNTQQLAVFPLLCSEHFFNLFAQFYTQQAVIFVEADSKKLSGFEPNGLNYITVAAVT